MLKEVTSTLPSLLIGSRNQFPKLCYGHNAQNLDFSYNVLREFPSKSQPIGTYYRYTQQPEISIYFTSSSSELDYHQFVLS